MPNRRRAGLLIGIAAGVLAVSANACSFALVTGPPPVPERQRSFACTDGREWPITDTVLAVVGAAASLFIVSVGSALGGSPKPQFYGFVLVSVVAPSASAIYGFNKVGDCRDAIRSAGRPVAEAEPTPTDL